MESASEYIERTQMSDTEFKLRKLLAIRTCEEGLYRDDGELHDAAKHPSIDFLRDSPDTIRQKFIIRNTKPYT